MSETTNNISRNLFLHTAPILKSIDSCNLGYSVHTACLRTDDKQMLTVSTTNLERSLQDANRECRRRVSGQPESKIWMRFGQFLQSFLQLYQPFHQKMAVL